MLNRISESPTCPSSSQISWIRPLSPARATGLISRKLRSRKPRRRKVAKERPDKEEEEGQEQHEPKSEPEQEPNPEDLMHLLMTALTVNPEEAGNILGIGRSSGYRAVRNKQIPVA